MLVEKAGRFGWLFEADTLLNPSQYSLVCTAVLSSRCSSAGHMRQRSKYRRTIGMSWTTDGAISYAARHALPVRGDIRHGRDRTIRCPTHPDGAARCLLRTDAVGPVVFVAQAMHDKAAEMEREPHPCAVS